MVDGLVVGRPRGGHRILNSKPWFSSSWLNRRPDGALRWKVKTAGWEGWGVVRGKLIPSRL
jgi:hypothetical protein